MRITYALLVSLSLVGCADFEDQREDSRFQQGSIDANKNRRDSSGLNASKKTSQQSDGVSFTLPESIESVNNKDGHESILPFLPKKGPKHSPGILQQVLPNLFGFSVPIMRDLFAKQQHYKPHCYARYHNMPQAEDKPEDTEAQELTMMPPMHWYPKDHRKVKIECTSEELENEYFGFLSVHLHAMKPADDQCIYPAMYQAKLIRCKSFNIVLPAVKDGDYKLTAFFRTAKDDARYKGQAEPVVTVKEQKIVSDSKLVMKKIKTTTDGSVEVVFED